MAHEARQGVVAPCRQRGRRGRVGRSLAQPALSLRQIHLHDVDVGPVGGVHLEKTQLDLGYEGCSLVRAMQIAS